MNARYIVAGVDDDGLAGVFIAEDGAVAGERADGKGLEEHGFIVGAEAAFRFQPRLRARPGDGGTEKVTKRRKTTIAIRFLFAIMLPCQSL
jgi:hypothetical protein